MSEQQNLLLVQEFYAAFKRGDIIGVLSTLADDVVGLFRAPKTSFRLRDSAKAASRSSSSSKKWRRRRTQSSLSPENS